MAISPFPELAGSLTRGELHQVLTNHPDMSLMGGEQDVGDALLVAFVSRNADRRVLALIFGPDTADSTRWILIGWVPVPRPTTRRRLRAATGHPE